MFFHIITSKFRTEIKIFFVLAKWSFVLSKHAFDSNIIPKRERHTSILTCNPGSVKTGFVPTKLYCELLLIQSVWGQVANLQMIKVPKKIILRHVKLSVVVKQQSKSFSFLLNYCCSLVSYKLTYLLLIIVGGCFLW